MFPSVIATSISCELRLSGLAELLLAVIAGPLGVAAKQAKNVESTENSTGKNRRMVKGKSANHDEKPRAFR